MSPNPIFSPFLRSALATSPSKTGGALVLTTISIRSASVVSAYHSNKSCAPPCDANEASMALKIVPSVCPDSSASWSSSHSENLERGSAPHCTIAKCITTGTRFFLAKHTHSQTK